MSEVHHVDHADAEASAVAIEAAVAAVEAGLLVVLPTETVYGIACRPDDPAVTARLFEAKQRPPDLNLPVLVHDVGSAWALGRRSEVAERLADAFWPGPLTLVLTRTEASAPWELGGHRDSIGVRLPDHPLARALLARTGPLAVTSANISGQPPLEVLGALQEAFGDRVAVYVGIRQGVAAPAGTPSTVVDLTGRKAVIVREGAIDGARVAAVAGGPPAR